MTARHGSAPGQWVLLSYRMPRDPSTPRIAVWRKLKRLGAAQISDGLVALPADARTREQLEWIAEEVTEASGSASIWIAQPATVSGERELAVAMSQARAAEYAAIIAEAAAAARATIEERQSLARRLRAELRRIHRRDYFPPIEREQAAAAVGALATDASRASGAAL
jgi:hypothetical protein